MAGRVAEPGLDGAADAEVERKAHAPRRRDVPRTSQVSSAEPSSTTRTSSVGSKARISSITPPIEPCSLNAGTIAILLTPAPRSRQQVEQLARAVPVGVLVEHALACAAAELARPAPGSSSSVAIGGDRLVGVVDDEQLRAGLEPALDPVVRVRDDRRAGGGELERPARRRRVDGRVRAARDAEVDARRRRSPRRTR